MMLLLLLLLLLVFVDDDEAAIPTFRRKTVPEPCCEYSYLENPETRLKPPIKSIAHELTCRETPTQLHMYELYWKTPKSFAHAFNFMEKKQVSK